MLPDETKMSHVTLCERPIRWSFAPSITTRVFYDGLHQEVVVLADAQCHVSDLANAKMVDQRLQ